MAASTELLTEEQLKALEAEKEELMKEQKLLNIDIKAMALEMRKRAGQPAPGPETSLAAAQELAQLSSDLTRLHLEEVNFYLVSAEDGVGLTRWRVRAVSQDADAEICIKYDVTKDEESNVTCSGLEVVDLSPSLGALVDAAGDDPRAVLFGLHQLAGLAAERKEALGSAAPADHTEPARLRLPGRKRLYWAIEMTPEEARYRRHIAVENAAGDLSPLPASLQEMLHEKGARALVDYLRSL